MLWHVPYDSVSVASPRLPYCRTDPAPPTRELPPYGIFPRVFPKWREIPAVWS